MFLPDKLILLGINNFFVLLDQVGPLLHLRLIGGRLDSPYLANLLVSFLEGAHSQGLAQLLDILLMRFQLFLEMSDVTSMLFVDYLS